MPYIAGDHDVYVDPVSHEEVAPGNSPAKTFYNGKFYHFATVVNMQTFLDDPELWIPTPHASVNSSNISPEDE